MAADALTSASIITPGLICASTVLAVLSMFRLISPIIAEFCAKSPTPVNVNMSADLGAVIVVFWKLANVRLRRFTASCATAGSVRFVILLKLRFMVPFMPNTPLRAMNPPVPGGSKFPASPIILPSARVPSLR